HVTANGNSMGAPCVFPFFYDGYFYNDCISFDHSTSWCSTTDNYTRDGQWGECLDYDVCHHHKNLSHPWRNIGCHTIFNTLCEDDDDDLKEGWYHFNGIGGDRLAYPCGHFEVFGAKDVQMIVCGAQLVLYYLIPIRGVYLTRK
ncbi:hypothetical protein NFI96_029668, partial [Prochilodus magdalenae]